MQTASPKAVAAVGAGRSASLRAVDRASADLRRGDPVLVRPETGAALLAQATETVTPAGIARLQSLTGETPSVAITTQRARVLGLAPAEIEGDGIEEAGVVELFPGAALDADLVRALSDPTATVPPRDVAALQTVERRYVPPGARDGILPVIKLAKLARLLPAALVARVERPIGVERLLLRSDLLSVSAYDIDEYDAHAARSLHEVARARVPLDLAEHTRIVAYRPTDGGLEHLAILVGEPELGAPVLVRLHSECFTGDLLGSLRCDCGDQLRGAIAAMAEAGSGVLLYLAQEGRGIGLVNKLRAYTLQDAEFDTVDANTMLGYDADERLYQPAARMLELLGIRAVRLLTNNPSKVDDLRRHGVEVAERVPHRFPSNGHNEFYLRTKKERSGHLL